MNITFNLLRALTAMTALGSILILAAIVLLRSSLAFAQESLGVLAYVGRLFTSGFTQGTAPRDPAGWIISFPQAGLALLFVAMLISVFLPENKFLLHGIACCTTLAAAWYLRMALLGLQLEILCLPALIVWIAYYAFCLLWPRAAT